MKRVALFALVLVFALVLPIVFMGALLVLSGNQTSPSAQALEEISPELIGIYQSAAGTCEGLDWTVLAAIHKVETGFGTGPATSHMGARGPMQFLSSTFSSYGVDGDGDRHADIDNVADAVFSAANLLCANGAGDPARIASAIWNYNHSQDYVNEVLSLASAYGILAAPGGVAFASTSDLLSNHRVILPPQARADLKMGIVDQRLVSLLSWISLRHTIAVSVFKTGHSKYTRSEHVSLHYFGRAADVYFVDGAPVSIVNLGARQVVLDLARTEGLMRPDEIGHPFGALSFPGGFTDIDHRDHIHIGLE